MPSIFTRLTNILLWAVCLLPPIAKGQSDSSLKKTPYYPEGNFEVRAVKGKILPWIGLPAGQAGINSLIGIEFSFRTRHSIGFDIYFNRWHSDEDRYDSIAKTYVYKYAFHARDKAVFINYRYYLKAEKIRMKKDVAPYIGAFARLGYMHTFYDKGYVTNTVYEDEIHYSSGILCGWMAAPHPGKIGYDINFGLFYKRKDITDAESVNQTTVISNPTTYNLGVRLGLNIYLWGVRKNIHKRSLSQNC